MKLFILQRLVAPLDTERNTHCHIPWHVSSTAVPHNGHHTERRSNQGTVAAMCWFRVNLIKTLIFCRVDASHRWVNPVALLDMLMSNDLRLYAATVQMYLENTPGVCVAMDALFCVYSKNNLAPPACSQSSNSTSGSLETRTTCLAADSAKRKIPRTQVLSLYDLLDWWQPPHLSSPPLPSHWWSSVASPRRWGPAAAPAHETASCASCFLANVNLWPEVCPLFFTASLAWLCQPCRREDKQS